MRISGRQIIYQRMFLSAEDGSEIDDLFCNLFAEELDSWVSTTYFMCSNCIDEFRKKWGGVTLIDAPFQTNSMPLYCFHSGSLLSEFFTADEFRERLSLITCPNCLKPLENDPDCFIWPYRLSFDGEKYCNDIKEISKIATSTPFLLLSSPFANETLKLIKEMAEASSIESIDTNTYRGRKTKRSNTILKNDEIGAVPDLLAKEGRYNHSGHGHLYIATKKEICLKEIGVYQREPACIAEITLLKPLKLLDLTDLDREDDLYQTIICSTLIYNSPLHNSWEKPEYVFTRFVADCAILAGFDGIKYRSPYSFEGFNYVIFKDKSKQNFSWDTIYAIKNVQLIR